MRCTGQARGRSSVFALATPYGVLAHGVPPLRDAPSPSSPPPFLYLDTVQTMAANLLKKRKIAVLGSRSVGKPTFVTSWHAVCLPALVRAGKSSLVIQFVNDHFIESYYPTIETTFQKTINYNGVEYDCDIIDTAGQVRSSSCYSLSRAHIRHQFTPSFSSASGRIFDLERKARYWYPRFRTRVFNCFTQLLQHG